jgi:pantoate--beta-alanine ligase
LRRQVAAWRREGQAVALVPTMGALHRGHLALVASAQEAGCRVVVSIFVNPTQFGPLEDFAAYPRREEADLALLAEAGADLAWIPSVAEMYPPGFSTSIAVAGVTEPLEGRYRPGHFSGVATVVAKLLLQVLPDRAYFGEKDYQQLLTIRRMVRDLDLPVRIEAVETVRERDGLALSSRNAYLSATERIQAARLPGIMRETAQAAARSGGPLEPLTTAAVRSLLAAGFDGVDYIAVCDAETLEPLDVLRRPARILVAARIGRTRLIDNMDIPGADSAADSCAPEPGRAVGGRSG